VAVSGGADSIALLHALQTQAKRFKWRLTVAHLHHGIRGRTADDDAIFVRQAAASLGLRCITGKARVPALARRRKCSIEMAAREARYAFLARTARRVGADVIATAHTADDQAETVLLRLVRGAGMTGLAGISRETCLHGCRVVRPLLDVARAGIEAYLRGHGWAWREDETNADRDFLRNRVRHELLPLLERDFNPRIRAALTRTSAVLAAEDEWLEELAGGLLRTAVVGEPSAAPALRCSVLARLPLAARRRVLRRWLIESKAPAASLDFETVERIAALSESAGGKSVVVGKGKTIRRVGERLVFGPMVERPPVSFRVRVPTPGSVVLPAQGIRVTARLAAGLVRERGVGPGAVPARASLNAAVWAGRPLFVRSLRPGDRISPFGLKGSKKLQDILVDAKVPRAGRALLPLFECGGKIVWVPGYRVAADWAVTDSEAWNLQLTVAPVHGRGRSTAATG
jgi:tRNA(Ile)-lysidine synthase